MSGIVGWLNFENLSNNEYGIFENMSNAIYKRGANSAFFRTNNIMLNQRQDNPIDKTFSMSARGCEFTIAFSGKLFNYRELRKDLEACGYEFVGKSDDEIVLKAYIEWGNDSVTKFNGNFAYAIWENKAKKLFIARDRMGIMPLFFYKYSKGIIFASEIKSLMANGMIRPEVDNYGIKQLLLLGPSRSCGCGIIKGVEELKPAEFLVCDNNSYNLHTFWKPIAVYHKDNLGKTVETTRELITDSITRQLEGEETPACFLSGGLDSSIITAVAADLYKKQGKTLNTYSVDYEGNDKFFVKNSFQSARDNYYIDIMSDFTKSVHKYFVLDTEEVAESIYDASVARDLPGMGDIDSSLLVLCIKVKKEKNICMSGECADEFLGGYPWYHRPELLFRDNFPWLNATDLRVNLYNSTILGGGNEEFIHDKYNQTVDFTDYLPTDDKQGRRIREMFMLNYYWFMQTLIDRTDRMAASSGLEVRVPYCDNKIVDYAFNMP
ncbi:MAG: asparagine synthase (glutamine-hydrolyzing), partial [Clostridia bacterium]